MKSLYFKYSLYYSTLIMVLLVVVIQRFDVSALQVDFFSLSCWLEMVRDNIECHIFIFLSLILFVHFFIFIAISEMSSHNTHRVIGKLENVNHDILGFFATYTFPIISLDSNKGLDSYRNFIVFLFITWFIGRVYIRSNLLYTNPLIAFLGFHVYKNEEGEIIISREQLLKGQVIKLFQLQNCVYLHLKTKKNDNSGHN